MTTIVYDHKRKQIACDGKILNNYQIRGLEFKKWRKSNGVYFFFAGTVADIELFMQCGKNLGDKSEHNIEVTALMVENGFVFECGYDDEHGFWRVPCEYSSALGSGSEYALAALDFGCNVKEAVKYAETKDVGTGGAIQVFDVEQMEFING